MRALSACGCAIVSVRMYPHTTIVYFYIRIPKNLVNVGSSRHKLPRHRKNCVGDTDPSGQNWSDTVCRRRHVATCRRHFQLSWGVLRRIAVFCGVLKFWRIVANCSVLRRFVANCHFTAFGRHFAAFCSVFWRFAMFCGVLRQIAAKCCELRRIAAFCGELLLFAAN